VNRDRLASALNSYRSALSLRSQMAIWFQLTNVWVTSRAGRVFRPACVYSERSAMIGSTWVARRAGMYPASAAIDESRAMAMTMVAGS
jgi:hypothetical protein